jgi:hypothetical protein
MLAGRRRAGIEISRDHDRETGLDHFSRPRIARRSKRID